jgi:hypothetical protein
MFKGPSKRKKVRDKEKRSLYREKEYGFYRKASGAYLNGQDLKGKIYTLLKNYYRNKSLSS